MIRHKVSELTDQNIYTVKAHICRSAYERANRLLNIDNLEELTDEQLDEIRAKKDDFTHMIDVDFEDGANLRWTLCSGSTNYYDDVLFTHSNGIMESLDCSYELDDIEIDTGANVYRVELDIQDDPDIRKWDQRFWEPDEYLWNTLFKHLGHHVEIVAYGDRNDPADVCLECSDCNEVVLDGEIYTICAREDDKK